MVEMPSGARASMTGLRADPGGHRDAAITCPQRLDATGINAGSGALSSRRPREKPHETRHTPPPVRVPKVPPRADLPAVARRRDARAGPLRVWVV